MFNEAQEIFLVLFSILYGVMLQSQPGGLFPLGRLLRGYIDKNGELGYVKGWEKISRKCEMFNWGVRSFLSILFLNVFPLIYFFFMFRILDNDIINIENFFDMFFIFWSSLGVFCFYRFYYIIICIYFKELFYDLKEEIVDKRKLSFDPYSHFIWACIYLFPAPNYFFYKYYSRTQCISLFINITIIILISLFLSIYTIFKFLDKNEINRKISFTLLMTFFFLIFITLSSTFLYLYNNIINAY